MSAFQDAEQPGEKTPLQAAGGLPVALRAAPIHPRVANQVEPARPLPPAPAARPLPAPGIAAPLADNRLASVQPAMMQTAGLAQCPDANCPTCRLRAWQDTRQQDLYYSGIELGGWVDGGFSSLGNSPADRFNGPVTFNDRNLEGQLNQLWLYLERKVDPESCGIDVGGRVDVMYGTDAIFIQASDGLEERWDQTNRFYQAALPQFYVDAGWDGWTAKVGRFFTPLGYERPAAPDNFFYSHSYETQYGKPFTHFGALFGKSLGEWSIQAGVHRGNDQFDDTDGRDAINFLGGLGYTGCGGCFTAQYALSATETGPDTTDYIHSIVAKLLIAPELEYVLVNNYGQSWNQVRQSTAVWYGINQYLTYAMTEELAAGLRFEWFRDLDGTRVHGIRDGNTLPFGVSGDFYAITFGLNYTPLDSLRIRPEVRWDFFDPLAMECLCPSTPASATASSSSRSTCFTRSDRVSAWACPALGLPFGFAPPPTEYPRGPAPRLTHHGPQSTTAEHGALWAVASQSVLFGPWQRMRGASPRGYSVSGGASATCQASDRPA